jgi:hypothetical protein
MRHYNRTTNRHKKGEVVQPQKGNQAILIKIKKLVRPLMLLCAFVIDKLPRFL